ncbi:NAD(P)H-hydrate dehydratase [Rhodococcus oryzae]|uniref:Bifunctional NAD(P)H-hydrate repair enzyme n=1 Tax=Rhodococcus oryzae TaxID=2571143 RepID=A0ABY2RRF4_9NOCA|nr:NAD(P)H-hydrate dehydratase [Rhodococcus oryzae]TJZ81656.1 NAD(P)H-hydrate dehydratase [Rhodococcus oryzae]
MRDYFTADEVRAAEAPLLAALPDGALMRRAAYGLTAVVASELRSRTGGVAGRRVTLLVGSGDNGGDALWAGAMLRRRGVAVRAVLLDPDRVHAAGLAALRAVGGRVEVGADADLGDPDLVVDGIVGISGRGPLRPAAAALVARVGAPIVAVDLPSGVDPDTGVTAGPAVTASVTVAFGALKPVHALAAAHCGRVELVDIGLDLPDASVRTPTAAEVGARWPMPGPADDKYSQGVVGVIAGSARYPGAGVLCAGAAVTATSGMVRYAGTAAPQVLSRWPEVVAVDGFDAAGRVQAWVVGPGMGVDEEALTVLRAVLGTDLPVLVDADALTLVAAEPGLVAGRSAPTLLTPHAGEFARLTGRGSASQRLAADRVAATRGLAAEWGTSVLLKGRCTVVADPDGSVLLNEAGGSAAATAGAGDVLSGVIGALMSTGLAPLTSAAMGARAHSLAANLAAGQGSGTAAPISADALLCQVRAAVRVLRAQAVP